MNFTLHKAVQGDMEDIAHVHVKSWRAAYEGIIHQSYLDKGIDKVQRQKMWEENLLKTGSDYEIFIVKDNDRIIGFANVGVSRDADRKDYAEIYAIYLDPEYFGRGTGRLLFETATQKIKNMNYMKLFMWVLDENKRGRDFYERMGAVLSKDIKNVVIDGHAHRQVCYEWISS